MGLSGQPNSQEKDSCIRCARMGKRGEEMGGWGGRVSGWVGGWVGLPADQSESGEL